MSKATLELIVSGNAKKGDVLGTARVAGIMAAKRTSDLIPLCHPLALSKVTLDIAPDKKLPGCIVRATVKVTGPTGVEMEALTAVSVACLTIYDMIKAVERGVRIEGIHLVEKKATSNIITPDNKNIRLFLFCFFQFALPCNIHNSIT